MEKEFFVVMANNTYELVSCPDVVDLIGNKQVHRAKIKSDSLLDKDKELVVAKRHEQVERIDYFEFFSPIVKP